MGMDTAGQWDYKVWRNEAVSLTCEDDVDIGHISSLLNIILWFSRLLTIQLRHKCQRVHFNSYPLIAAYMRQGIGWALVQIMAYRLFGAKSLYEPMQGFCQFDP